jgi:hypothetical protein
MLKSELMKFLQEIPDDCEVKAISPNGTYDSVSSLDKFGSSLIIDAMNEPVTLQSIAHAIGRLSQLITEHESRKPDCREFKKLLLQSRECLSQAQGDITLAKLLEAAE